MTSLNTCQNKTVIFFINLDKKYGIGHFQRCLKFSSIFKNFEKTIVSENKENFKNFKTIKYKDFLKTKNFYNFAVIDNYKIKFSEEKKIKSRVLKIITIDDLCNRKFCSNFIINYDPLIKKNIYKNKKDKNSLLLLGKNFNFLENKEFSNTKIKKKIKVFIYLGQKNREELIKNHILPKLKKEYIEEIIIASKYNFNFKGLKLTFKYFKNYKETAKIIANCNIIIVSAGVTIYEALSQKKLIFTSKISTNQNNNYKYLIKHNLVKDIKELKNLKLKNINNFYKKIKSNEKKIFYNDYSVLKKIKTIIFGIKNKKNYHISLDSFNKEDINKIYKFQTDEYRKYYKNKNTFSLYHHKNYLKKFFERKGNFILTIKKNMNNIIGYIKFEKKQKGKFISIIVIKKYQNYGIATNVLKFINSKNFINDRLFAEINKKNVQSIMAFKKAGFKGNKLKFFS